MTLVLTQLVTEMSSSWW